MEWNFRRLKTAAIYNLLFSGIALPLLVSTPSQAEEGQAAPAASAPAVPDRWWEKNALTYDPIPQEPRFHTEISASRTESNGNLNATVTSVTAELVARKGRWSNYAFYTLTDQVSVLSAGRGSIEQKQWTGRDYIRYDLFKNTYLALGYEEQRDDPTFIKKRSTVFGGAGLDFQPAAAHNITVLAAYGDEDREYIDISALTSTSTVENEDGLDGIYINNTYAWVINPTLTFKQTGYLMKYFDSEFGERWGYTLGLDVMLMPMFYLTISYTESKNENPAQAALGTKEKDDTQVVGFKFTF